MLEDKLVELDHQRDEITETLAEVDAELVYNNLNLLRVTNYPVKVLRRGERVFCIIVTLLLNK